MHREEVGNNEEILLDLVTQILEYLLKVIFEMACSRDTSHPSTPY